MSAGYWELAVPAPDEVAEALTNFLWELGALGVVEEEVAGGAPTLRAFFSTHSEASTLAARVRAYADGLRALGFAAPDAPTITAIRHWLIHVPFTAPIAWGSGSRSGPTRLVVEVTTDAGIRGYGETICLLDSIEPVLVNVVKVQSEADFAQLKRVLEGD